MCVGGDSMQKCSLDGSQNLAVCESRAALWNQRMSTFVSVDSIWCMIHHQYLPSRQILIILVFVGILFTYLNKNENALFEFEFENVNVKSDFSNGTIDFNEFAVYYCWCINISTKEHTHDTRFVIFYILSLMCLYSLYEVTSAGEIDIYESVILTLLWFLYVTLLVIDEPLPCCDESNDTQREYRINNKGEFKGQIEFMENITRQPKRNANGADAGNAEKGDATGTIKEEGEASQRPQIITSKNDPSVNKAIAAKNTKKSTFGGIVKPSMSEYDPVDYDRADGGENTMSESVSRSSHAIFVDARTVSALEQQNLQHDFAGCFFNIF